MTPAIGFSLFLLVTLSASPASCEYTIIPPANKSQAAQIRLGDRLLPTQPTIAALTGDDNPHQRLAKRPPAGALVLANPLVLELDTPPQTGHALTLRGHIWNGANEDFYLELISGIDFDGSTKMVIQVRVRPVVPWWERMLFFFYNTDNIIATVWEEDDDGKETKREVSKPLAVERGGIFEVMIGVGEGAYDVIYSGQENARLSVAHREATCFRYVRVRGGVNALSMHYFEQQTSTCRGEECARRTRRHAGVCRDSDAGKAQILAQPGSRQKSDEPAKPLASAQRSPEMSAEGGADHRHKVAELMDSFRQFHEREADQKTLPHEFGKATQEEFEAFLSSDEDILRGYRFSLDAGTAIIVAAPSQLHDAVSREFYSIIRQIFGNNLKSTGSAGYGGLQPDESWQRDDDSDDDDPPPATPRPRFYPADEGVPRILTLILEVAVSQTLPDIKGKMKDYFDRISTLREVVILFVPEHRQWMRAQIWRRSTTDKTNIFSADDVYFGSNACTRKWQCVLHLSLKMIFGRNIPEAVRQSVERYKQNEQVPADAIRAGDYVPIDLYQIQQCAMQAAVANPSDAQKARRRTSTTTTAMTTLLGGRRDPNNSQRIIFD